VQKSRCTRCPCESRKGEIVDLWSKMRDTEGTFAHESLCCRADIGMTIYSPGDGGAVEDRKIPNISKFRGIKWYLKKYFFSKFHDVFTLAPPSLFKSRPAGTAPLNGRTVKSNVDESFSLYEDSNRWTLRWDSLNISIFKAFAFHC
jgi:hypothetical protein